MPKQKRYTIKRQFESAGNGIKKAMDVIALLGHDYQEGYPEIYDQLCNIQTILDMANDLVTSLKDRI